MTPSWSLLIWWISYLVLSWTTYPAKGQTLSITGGEMSWNDAFDYCASIGQQLLSIHSVETQEEAQDLCDTKTHSDATDGGCWVGLYRISEDDDWIWSDGSTTDYGFVSGATSGNYPWKPGEPNGDSCFWWWETCENCIQLQHSAVYRWNDNQCDTLGYPICRM